MGHGGRPWVADPHHPHYQAARNAIVKGIKKKCYAMYLRDFI